MFNVYKNQLSRQTGSRNLTGPKTLPTIWHYYMKFVTKYQISAIFLPVPSTNKTDCHDITEILLNTINQTKPTKGLFPKIHEYIAIDCFSSNYLLETRQILDFEII
jgi:hypothetical protein